MTRSPERHDPAARIRRVYAEARNPDPGSVPIPLRRVPGLLASWGLARPSIVAVTRWTTRGRDGVKLPSFSDGRRRCTTSGALRSFVKEANLS